MTTLNSDERLRAILALLFSSGEVGDPYGIVYFWLL